MRDRQGWILGVDWVPYQRAGFVTPAFPGYVSGHSTYSRAAAEVLTSLTGSEFFPGGMYSVVFTEVPYIRVGDFNNLTARSAKLEGYVPMPWPFFWNTGLTK